MNELFKEVMSINLEGAGIEIDVVSKITQKKLPFLLHYLHIKYV